MSKNATRTALVALTVVITILLGEKLDQFLSIIGSLFCTPIAFTFPAMFHLKACAVT
jgi:amino acid permease